MKIGIFGGSFNPPHLMHKIIAEGLIENGYLDKVIFVPTGDKYNKKTLINSNHRYNMTKLMIEGNDKLDISDYEIIGTLKYTYQTLNYFNDKFKKDTIYFICGADNLSYINKWKNYKDIISKYPIIVIGRNDINIENVINEYPKCNIIKANINSLNISSTNIRNNLSERYLNKDVYKYILKNKLYK